MPTNTSPAPKRAKKNKTLALIVSFVTLLLVGAAIFITRLPAKQADALPAISDAADNLSADVSMPSAENSGEIPPDGLTIPVSDISENALFVDYTAGTTQMQVLAVLGSDGEIRLALNTCQVCAGSPKAYFVQKGSSFICQNCGNAFRTDQIGAERGGCNPVPIQEAVISEDIVTVSADALSQYAGYFKNWKGKNL